MEKKIIFGNALVLLLLLQVSASSSDELIVITQLQTIKGQHKASYEGRQYEAYEGIPYALPPTGIRRFQPPYPITTKSNDVINATSVPPLCIQYGASVNMAIGQEDCLYLNIYTPSRKKQLPVIFWIHGGGFQNGAGHYDGARYLMDRDLILVTMNYRLIVFGFLSTEDEIITGNMGLKDQNLALKWVVENIHHFGGNPKKISLMGGSAGGSSVHYHYLSKMSRGLFSSGVSFSGTALTLWAYNPKPLETAKRLAGIVGCPTETSRKMVECFKAMDAKKLTEGSANLWNQATNKLLKFPFFVPVAEKTTKLYFINQAPEEILRSGDIADVPWISGMVSEDGCLYVADIALDQKSLNYLDEHWEPRNSYMQMFSDSLPIAHHPEITWIARRHYIGDDRPLKVGDQKTLWGLTYLMTNESFAIILEKSVTLQALANKSPVYAYYYSYRATQSDSDHRSNSKQNFGVCHMDDVKLVLENTFMNPTTTASDKAMLKTMLDFWYTTALTGKPSLGVEWPPVDSRSKDFTFMHIAGPNDATVESSGNFGDKKFWSSVGYQLDV